jgi:DNA-binding response OmpR family regulator
MSDLEETELPSSIITVGPIRVDALHHEVSIDGKTSRLTPNEFMVLHFLAVHVNTVCTFSQIGSYAYGSNNDGANTLVKVDIIRLRHKIEPDPTHPIYILTVPGEGYTLVSHDLDETMQKTNQ